MTKGRESTNGDKLHLIQQKVHLYCFHVSTNMICAGRKRSIREFLRLVSLFQVYETHGQLSEELLSFVPEFLASVYFCMSSIDAKVSKFSALNPSFLRRRDFSSPISHKR